MRKACLSHPSTGYCMIQHTLVAPSWLHRAVLCALRSGRHFETMTSKWFHFEEAFIYAFMYYFENRRELSYMCSERLLAACLCATVMKVEWLTLGIAARATIMWAWQLRKGIFLASYQNFGALWDWKRYACTASPHYSDDLYLQIVFGTNVAFEQYVHVDFERLQ